LTFTSTRHLLSMKLLLGLCVLLSLILLANADCQQDRANTCDANFQVCSLYFSPQNSTTAQCNCVWNSIQCFRNADCATTDNSLFKATIDACHGFKCDAAICGGMSLKASVVLLVLLVLFSILLL
jgi:hypothetical protein